MTNRLAGRGARRFINGWVLLGIAAYAVSLAVLWPNKNFGHGDAVFELIVFGFVFPVLAWVATIWARPLAVRSDRSAAQVWLLFACLAGVSIYLIWGASIVQTFFPLRWLGNERISFFIGLTRKLVVFVAIPFVLFRGLFGYRWADFGVQRAGLRALGRDHLPVVLVLSGAILLFQYFLGGAAAPIRHGEVRAAQLVIGLPLCFAWLLVETGLVEEFFFRALVQARLATWFRSETSGVALMALLFGLAHAPGFILRRAGAVESIGGNATAAESIAYSIVVLSVSGVFFGIVWARTRNLFALMTIHAATDLLPNFAAFAKTWM